MELDYDNDNFLEENIAEFNAEGVGFIGMAALKDEMEDCIIVAISIPEYEVVKIVAFVKDDREAWSLPTNTQTKDLVVLFSQEYGIKRSMALSMNYEYGK